MAVSKPVGDKTIVGNTTHGSERYACGVTPGQDVVNVVHANDLVGHEIRILGLGLETSCQKVSPFVLHALRFNHEPLLHPLHGEVHNRMSRNKRQKKRALGDEFVHSGNLTDLSREVQRATEVDRDEGKRTLPP